MYWMDSTTQTHLIIQRSCCWHSAAILAHGQHLLIGPSQGGEGKEKLPCVSSCKNWNPVVRASPL